MWGLLLGLHGRIISYIPFSEECDIPRFMEFYDGMIADGALTTTKSYVRSRNSLLRKVEGQARREDLSPGVKKKARLTSPRGATSSKVGGGDMNSLAAAILAKRGQREADHDSFVDSLAAKYGKKPGKRNKKEKKQQKAKKPR